MNDDFTPDERDQARRENWDVFHVWDTDKKRWLRMALPVTFGPEATAQHVLSHVIASAKLSRALHIKALRLITHYKAPNV